MIGLDGYESSIGDRLMAEGRMAHLAALRNRCARWLLDHGPHRDTGLAWEQVACGMAPDRSGRWSAIEFDAKTYRIWQSGAVNAPFAACLDAKTIVFDAPYFDLTQAPDARGATNWGAHDPGVAPQCRPAGLSDEIRKRFGPYKARKDIYGFLWPDAEETRAAGARLTGALDQRTEIMRWLIGERFTDWDLAISVVGELHSAIEPMWHGLDERHPLHNASSATAARQGLEAVYEALDRHIGALRAAAPDAAVVCFAMHGMGPNNADAPAMLLLPELLYRLETGKALFTPPKQWREARGGVPMLPAGAKWEKAVLGAMRGGQVMRLKDKLENVSKKLSRRRPARRNAIPLRMPAARYAHAWPRMRAFGFPAYYDGRIRINLQGREARGIVPLSGYSALIDELSAMLRSLQDPRTGAAAVADIQTPVASDPLSAHPTQADLIVSFNDAPLALEHPEIGIVGPVPFRRTGGHTGRFGVLYISAPDVVPGDYGARSSFDVVPTIARLLGNHPPDAFSGEPIPVPGVTTGETELSGCA
jgi:predicted AlkP superfamily phosphohydrolase/phosphomutase